MSFRQEDLAERLRRAWSSATATTWTAENPAKGQCSVTAIAVQRMLGGDILKTETAEGVHFYNCINGVRYDFTSSQFTREIEYKDLRSSAEEALSDTSESQLKSLLVALGEQP